MKYNYTIEHYKVQERNFLKNCLSKIEGSGRKACTCTCNFLNIVSKFHEFSAFPLIYVEKTRKEKSLGWLFEPEFPLALCSKPRYDKKEEHYNMAI